MRTTLHLLLLLIPFGGYKGQPTFATETKKVGQSVSLECPRNSSEIQALHIWIRLASGSFPEILGQMSPLDKAEPETRTSKGGRRITVKQEPGKFVLQISQVQKIDTALYYCFELPSRFHKMTFLNGIFLLVKDVPEAETAVTAVNHDLQFNESRSRCSVFSRSGNKTCADGHNFYWLRAGPEDSNPHFIYTHDECEKVANGSMQKCIHAFHNTVDAGTYSCAVATCGHIFMAKATKVITKDPSKSDFLKTVIFVMAAALTLISFLSAFLIYKVKTKTFCCCIACLQTREETCSGVQQRTEDTLVYSAPTIVPRKSGKASQTRARKNEDFSTYTDVCLRET
ncbi:uncharacterized protein [Syngnathus scovelli]|uniref:uncharacterized protein isoform X1 n=1 Tax=Syngnathus scovelli TaxID=161590 RepID=UPI00210F905E|nr:uncharacterized protein LOC125986656 isoform X1 [Syngnathus scovelli]XP_049606413.1 uncharacterized protein LOC125986656 isoform X2 [Syngnathus scovelli]